LVGFFVYFNRKLKEAAELTEKGRARVEERGNARARGELAASGVARGGGRAAARERGRDVRA
jgi:hypothetical protein